MNNLPHKSHFIFQYAKYRLSRNLNEILSSIIRNAYAPYSMNRINSYNYNSNTGVYSSSQPLAWDSTGNLNINCINSNQYNDRAFAIQSAMNSVGLRVQDVQLSSNSLDCYGSSPSMTYTITAESK